MGKDLEFSGTKENTEVSFLLLRTMQACMHRLVIESFGSVWV